MIQGVNGPGGIIAGGLFSYGDDASDTPPAETHLIGKNSQSSFPTTQENTMELRETKGNSNNPFVTFKGSGTEQMANFN